MEVLGVEREMVYPCVPGPLKLLELSNNDQVMPRTYAEFLFFFSGEKSEEEEEEEDHHHHHHHGLMSFMDSTQLKLSLSKTLSEFYVLAGRLKKRPNGGVDVDCNNMGVVFVEARTHSSLDHLDGFQPHPSFRLLVADAEVQFGDKDFSEMPLLLAQVTRFKCGGVALGLRVHHHVIDGAAFSYFVTSWAEISRGQQISVTPTLDRSAMKARNPPTPQFEHIEYSIINIDSASLYPAGGFPAMAAAIFDFSSKDVKCLKTQAELSTEDGISFTGFEILAGHLWRSITKARGIDPSKDLKFGLAVDGRSRFNPPLPNGYFGNVNFYGSAQSNAGELLSKPLSHAARCVHNAITRMTDEYLRSALDFVEVQESPLFVQPSFKCFLGSDLAISSWIWFPCYDIDYGWGKPVFFGVPVSAFDGLVILLPSPEGNGAVKALIGLRTDHLRSLQADPQFHPVQAG